MTKTVHLRIKREFFDQIIDGSKTTEYRDRKRFYAFLERDKFDAVELVCGPYNYALIELKSVEIIKTPKELKNIGIPFGNEVYALRLGKILKKRVKTAGRPGGT